MSDKRNLLIAVECGKVTCGECDWLSTHGGACEMFEVSLVDDCVRCEPCLAAERRAEDLMLKTAVAKAAAATTATPAMATE